MPTNPQAREELNSWADANGWRQLGDDPYSSLYRNIRGWREVYEEVVGAIGAGKGLATKPTRLFRDFPVIQTDNAILISDVEIPDQYALMLQLALYTAMARGIKKLIIVGDLIATDQPTLNHFVSAWRNGDEKTFEKMIGTTREILLAFLEWFEEIEIIEGNHDDRVARKTGGEVHLGMFLNDLDRVKYSRYHYLYIRTEKRGLIKAIHPINFSQNPLTMVKDFYAGEQGPCYEPTNAYETFEKCGYFIAHCHVAQLGTTPDGVFPAVAMGTMRLRYATQYVMQQQTRHRQWDNAFGVLQDGHAELMNLVTTNWRRQLGDNLYRQVTGLDKVI